MSLRNKIIAVIGATVVGLIGGLHATSSNILSGSIQKAEERHTRQVVKQVLRIFEQNQQDFNSRFVDWSAWDETYRFIEDGNKDYIESNLIAETLANLKVNLVLYIDRSGRIVFGTGFDVKKRQRRPLSNELYQFPTSSHQFSVNHPLLVFSDSPNQQSGILLVKQGILQITSQPILTSKGTGPYRGTVIFGRYLDALAIKRLTRIVGSAVTIYRMDDDKMPADLQAMGKALTAERDYTQQPILVRSLSGRAIAGYTIIDDIYGKPALLLRVEVERNIYQVGQSSQRYLILSVLVVIPIFGGVTLLLVERLILSRIASLSAGVTRISKCSNLSERLSIGGNDELSRLADAINSMLAALEDSQRQQLESEQRYRAVIEQSSEGIFLFDAQTGRILEANTAFRQLLGYSDDILSLTIYDFIASDRESIHHNIQRILAEQHLLIGERCYRRRDGCLLEVEVSASLILSGGEQVLCAVVRDITSRKQVEQALRQAEAKYRQIFENAAQGIYQSSVEGRYISANTALAKLYGYRSGEELMANITNIGEQVYVDPNRYAKFVSAMHKYDTVSRFVSQVYRADRSTIWISETARAVYDTEGNLLYYEGTVEDVTERKIVAEALRFQQEESERLLLNILPGPIAARLQLAEDTIADSFADVSVLFADLVGFTQICAQMPPTQIVSLLNEIFSTFDNLAEEHGLEKIKTIGDAYMVAGGLPLPDTNHAEAVAEMALDMLEAIAKFTAKHGKFFSIRIGINTGPVVAGVIGIKRLIYDLWGDTVNIASRMESQGIPGCIQVTESTYQRLRDNYIFEQRGAIQVKGKGEMTTYLLIGKKVPMLASQLLEQEVPLV
ncbi:MAG TPA: histidine kinase [Cyanobacteria bacterium UBA11369]|nr:histidine kinase [Cyanobacteria bacterium UBA11371]HBE35795.1 histidine kinase [Cyanobacteria bacterium UBA11368]HBE54035.1 histidine kinase [Cyanobacteria bacterium UBA11369]